MPKTPKPTPATTPRLVAAVVRSYEGPPRKWTEPSQWVATLDDTHDPLLGLQDGVLSEMSARTKQAPGDAAHWYLPMVVAGLPSVMAAAESFSAAGDLTMIPGSTLYAMADAIAHEFRRKVLFVELQSTGWNLAHVADRLRMKGSGAVLTAIRSHGLEPEYEKAKAEGRVAGRGQRTRHFKSTE